MTLRTLVLPAAVLSAAALSAVAQTPAAPPANPISVSTAKIFTMLSGVAIAAAGKMPEENYAFKPAPDVRTFGQLVGHLADSQYYFCALAAGETMPSSAAEKTKTTKADLVAALKDAASYCSKTYAAMTDARGSEMVKLMNIDFARLAVLVVNTSHIYEHYGNISTYMRIKGLVPPTSEKQAAPDHK